MAPELACVPFAAVGTTIFKIPGITETTAGFAGGSLLAGGIGPAAARVNIGSGDGLVSEACWSVVEAVATPDVVVVASAVGTVTTSLAV